mmetsp:Transcript_5274/g.14977  ORF Transcript_5274/g.14977 Transcript_5274/m.14977 type:complete len:266 (+) Transcript_5274:1768-2565(+)
MASNLPSLTPRTSSTLDSATSSSKPGGGLFNSPENSFNPKPSSSDGETPRASARRFTSKAWRFSRKESSAAAGSTSQACNRPPVRGSVITTGSPPLDLRSTSRASPREWAGSVETTRTLRSVSKSEARVTASVDDMVVFPTPPLPPTKMVRGGLPGDGLDADSVMSLIRLVREKRRVLRALVAMLLVSSSTGFLPTKPSDLLLLLVDIDTALVGNIKERACIEEDLVVVGTWNPNANGGIMARIPMASMVAGDINSDGRWHIVYV